MSTIHIEPNFTQNVTVVSNAFLDRFLPSANGDFIKLYLYLLRHASSGSDMTLTSIADQMNCTETDVFRALKYWEKEGILSLRSDDENAITGISFLEPDSDPQDKTEPDFSSDAEGENTEEVISAISAEEELPKPSDITTERLAELGQRDEIRELFFIAQQYLNHPLSRTEMQHICYYYDDLHFSADLIDYLLEYCISRNHTSMHYIDKVALGWHANGIVTVHDARKSVESYHKEYYDILKALGINNHHPVGEEIKLMKKWLEKYHFSMDIIEEACTRTVMNAAKPSLNYADSILSRWNARGVKTLDDVKALDAEHVARSAASVRRKNQTSSKVGRYNNFEQRKYDYNELERQLANSINN